MVEIERRYAFVALFLAVFTCNAAAQVDADGINVRIVAKKHHVNVGEPIPVQFVVENWRDEPTVLYVPGTDPRLPPETMGLPIEHVFSGDAYSALSIRNDQNRTWNTAVNYQPPAKAPVVTLSPRSSLGAIVDIREYYAPLKSPGTYRIQWQPYGGMLKSNLLVIHVAPLKQAEIVTDTGVMTMKFYYEEAPRHIDNFIDLARQGFYDSLTFHRIETGFFLQGGCPSGDGTGIRPDGVKIPGELSNRAQTRGVVSMALLDEDPDSASCQFFITNTDVPSWTGRYTIFGELIGPESYETLDRLMATDIDEFGRPVDRLFIRTIRITDAPRDDRRFNARP